MTARQSIRSHLLASVVVALVLVAGLGGWAWTSEFAGAVIAQGQMVVDSNVKKVQHPTGGVVAELNVRDGSIVSAGDIVIKLDDTQTRANLQIVVKGLDELMARRAREEAEIDGMQTIEFPADLTSRRSDPEVERILVNAKCQRPGVCNAAESLLVHRDVAAAFLPRAAAALRQRGVELRGCEETRRLVPDCRAATEEDFAAEYLDLILSIKVVDTLEAAIEHINRYGSQHSDTIITGDLTAARRFTAAVDSAAVFVNASTRFHDGYEFGLGAEIGISTDKFHARGPCGLLELTSYKYVVYGDGQVRQ